MAAAVAVGCECALPTAGAQACHQQRGERDGDGDEEPPRPQVDRMVQSLFSYEILGLVGRRQGAGAHDLVRLARRDRMFAWAGERQYYLEPKRLARLGYLTARSRPGSDAPADRLHAHRRGPAGVARLGA